MRKWNDEIDNFIRENVPCQDKHELLNKINSKFGTSFSYNALVTNMTVKRIRAGIKPWQNDTGKFRGAQPRPVGAELIKKDYVRIKVAQPNVWKQKQVWVYEQYHGIEVKKSECVIFLDGNNRNFEISNLEVIPRSIMPVLNGLRTTTDTPEIVKVKIAIARIKIARTELAKKHGLCFITSKGRVIKTDQKQRYLELKNDPERYAKYKQRAAARDREKRQKMKTDKPEQYAELLRKNRERRRKKTK